MSEMPPARWKGSYAERLGMRYDHVEPGLSRATLVLRPEHENPNGVCHGGAIFTFADDSMGAALHGLCPPGHHPVSTQVNIHLTRSGKPGDTLKLETTVASAGQRTALVETRVNDAEDRLVALLTASYLFIRPR